MGVQTTPCGVYGSKQVIFMYKRIKKEHVNQQKPGHVVKPSTGCVRSRIKAHSAVVLGNSEHAFLLLEATQPAKVDQMFSLIRSKRDVLISQ